VDESITELRTSGWTDQLEAIVGYVELAKTNEDKIKKLSGKGGVFVSSLRKHVVSWPAVSWRHPEKDETMKQYFERIQRAATELDKPMAYRRGGGAAIGIVVDQEDEGQEHAWTASGVPHFWGPVTFREWLEAQGWTILDCRAPASKSQHWSIRGLLKGQNGRSYSYKLEGGEEDAYIMIKRWEKKRRVEGASVPIGGSSWWHKDANFDPIEEDEEIEPTLKWEAQIAQTVPDSADTDMKSEEEGNNKAEKTKIDDSTGGSPPKKRVKGGGKKKIEDIDRVEGGMPGPGKKTTIIDTGGSGECGWRALSFSVAAHNASGDTNDEDLVQRLDILSKTMQAKVTSYVISHKKTWADTWCVDPNTNAQMENGPVAQSVEEFCEAIRRPKRWVCGLVMAGAAMAQRINIVIWTKKEGEWVRIAILRGGKDWQKCPVIPLILSRGHYFAMRMQKAPWPKEWAYDADDIQSSQDLRNDIQLRANFGRGGTDEIGTPIKRRCCTKKGKEEDEVERLLRTCSSKATEKTLNELLRTCSTRRTGGLGTKGRATSCKSVIKDKCTKKTEDAGKLLRTCSTVKSTKSCNDESCRTDIKWRCPICEEVITSESKPVATQKIASHMVRLHYQKWREGIEANKWFHKRKSGFNLGVILRPIKFVEMEEKDKMEKAEYLCPYCPLVLPRVHHGQVGLKAQALVRRSKRLHLKECKGAKHNSLRKYWKDFVRVHSDFYKRTSSERWFRSGVKHAANTATKAEQAGHEPVVFQFPWKCPREYGRFAIICKTCRRPFGRQNARNRNRRCKGADSIPCIMPGARFWQTVGDENLQELVCGKLGLSKAQAEESIRAAEGWRPRVMGSTKKQC